MRIYILVSEDTIGMPIEGVFFSEEEALEAAYSACIIERLSDEDRPHPGLSKLEYSDISFEIDELDDTESSPILGVPVLRLPVYAHWYEYHYYAGVSHNGSDLPLEYIGEVNLAILVWGV